MPRYYLLAKGTKPLPSAGDFPWPYEVALCFEGVSRPVVFSEGVGHGAAGGVFSAREALSAEWVDHITHAKAQWLLPFIEQMAAGQAIEADAVIRHYIAANHREPESFVDAGV